MGRRMKRCLGYLYLVIVLGICLAPLLAMEKIRTFSVVSQIYGKEGVNWNFLQEVGEYFEEHFAFRQELVTMDAGIRADIFGVSPVSDVIVGEHGWLYYTATLDDFQHKDILSDRMLFNIAHNVALMQQYAESIGKKFVFTVAPNKNSLYAENMPDRLSYRIVEKSDMERLKPWLEREKVNYVDLFALFSSQDEVLYYRRDSHWNQKGAVLVYNKLLDACGRLHMTYEENEVWITNDYYGDLGLMLFPTGKRPEEYLHYMGGAAWEYRQGEKVEDTVVITECETGSQNLLMYRDSFGNSLLPLMAGEFSQAVFSRQVPYTLTDLVTYSPDIVILEKVERHLPTLGKIPPVMSAPEAESGRGLGVVEKNAGFSISKEGSYWKITGTVDAESADVDSRIFVEVEDADGSKVYEAFCVCLDQEDGSSDYGFAVYISEVMVRGNILNAKVLTER